uniref:Uncharacterized protein n=1 Tax=Timema douglasi TaxID=61478 RepID=A0A7R8ZDI6_TIMDO|nr:unnamed protein product [Timema douglasi]
MSTGMDQTWQYSVQEHDHVDTETEPENGKRKREGNHDTCAARQSCRMFSEEPDHPRLNYFLPLISSA